MSEFLLSLYAGDHPARLILLVLAQTVVLVAVTLLIAARLSRNAAARHLLLLSAFLAIVVCPILTCVFEAAGVSLAVLPLPSQQVFTPQPVPEPSASFCDFPRERPAPDAEEGLLPSSAIGNDMPTVILQATPAVGEEATSVSWPDRLRAAFSLGLIGWIGGATLRFSGMLLSFYRVCSVIRSAQPITIDNHVCLPGDICRRLRIQHLPVILSSPDVSVPVAVGLLRPAILIPAAIRDQLDGNQWRHILIHETAHILRRDHLCLLLQALIAAIFWVNPLIHVLNRRLVQAREEVCDNYVLAFTNARSYGETLLDLAKLIPSAGRLAFSPGLLGIRWKLQDRISGLLDPRRKTMIRTPAGTAVIVLGLHLFLVAMLAAAGAEPATNSSETGAGRSNDQAEADSDAAARWQGVAESIAEADRERRMRRELRWHLQVDFRSEPLIHVAEYLQDYFNIPFRLGEVDGQTRVTIKGETCDLGDCLKPVGFGFVADGRALVLEPLRRVDLRDLGETMPVSHWVEALSDEDPATRRQAAEILSLLARRPKKFVPMIVETLKDQDAVVRRWSARALGNQGRDAAVSVPAMVTTVNDADAQVRLEVVRALGKIDDVAAAPAIASALKDEDGGVRQGALEVLFLIGCDLPVARECLLEIVQDRERGLRIRGKAARALVMSGPQGQYSLLDIWMEQDGLLRQYAIRVSRTAGPPALPFFMQVLDMETQDAQRSETISSLGSLGALAHSATPTLIETMNHPVARMRIAAAEALARIEPEAELAIPALLAGLNDEDQRVRAHSATALGALGPEAKSSVPALTQMLTDEHPSVQTEAAKALGKIGGDAAGVVPELIKLLKQDDWRTRKEAIIALETFGPASRGAVPALMEAFKDDDRNDWAGETLVAIGSEAEKAVPELIEMLRGKAGQPYHGALRPAEILGSIGAAAVPPLLEMLNDPERSVRIAAAQALELAGPAAADAIPTLVKLLRSQEPTVELTRDQGVGYYAKALGKIGPPALPVLSEMLGDADPRIRGWAALGLQAMGADAKPAIPGLTNALDDEDPEVVAFAAAALGAVGARTDRVVPQLIRTLRHEHWHCRHGAAVGLGRVGPAAEVALPDLVSALENDADSGVRYQAAEAFKEIYVKPPSRGFGRD
jgi:HEAT repeat protein/beta-lactamase regulating signal transducer with metallopeptidase domain